MSSPSSRLLGRYRLLDEIGRGGMAVVYRGFDPVIDREVAIKLIVGDRSWEERWRDRFLTEARAAGRLEHEGIITVHDVGEQDGKLFQVMELLDGCDLESYMERAGAPQLSKALSIACDAADALAYAHERGVLHRDIKPANIFITGRGRVKILDFGIAKVVQEIHTETGMVLGTPGFMAPEVLGGEPACFKSDLFSFGCVLQQLATGTRPFRGSSISEVLLRIVNEPPEPLPAGLPGGLGQLITECLEKDPAKRPDDMVEVQARLTTVSSGLENASLVPTQLAPPSVLLEGGAPRLDGTAEAESTKNRVSAEPRSERSVGSRLGSLRPSWAIAVVLGAALLWLIATRIDSGPGGTKDGPEVGQRLTTEYSEAPRAKLEAAAAGSQGDISSDLEELAAATTAQGVSDLQGSLAGRRSVCVSTAGGADASRPAEMLIIQELSRRAISVLERSPCRWFLDVIVDSGSSEDAVWDAVVIRNRAQVSIKAVEASSGAVLFVFRSPEFANAVQDAAVGRKEAVTRATEALIEAHGESFSVFTNGEE